MTFKILHRNPPVPFATRERCVIEEILNEREIPHVSVARARVDPGVTTELHAVTGTEEVYILEQGQGVVDDGTGTPAKVSAGDKVIIDASSPQRISNTSNEELVFLCVCTPRFEQKNYQMLDASPSGVELPRPDL